MEEWEKYKFKSKLEMDERMSEIWYDNQKLTEVEVDEMLINMEK